MRRALALAARGVYSTHPNPRVGCVIVKESAVVGEGWHARAGEPHAEVLALREAGPRARGAEIYVTLEPCAHVGRTGPCVEALVAAGVGRVFAAMQDPNPLVAGKGFARLRAAGIEIDCGVLASEAAELNRGFVSRMTRARPWVTLKLAASLDGRTAAASGESRWITGRPARADVHRLRAQAGAVLSSSETVQADDPLLNVRDFAGAPDIAVRVPDRIVLDRRGRVSATARVWNDDDGARRLCVVGEGAQAVDAPAGVERITVAADGAGLDLSAAFAALAQRDVNEVLVECGPRLAGALLAAHRVDELVLYLAPSLLGDAARPLAHLPGLQLLDERIGLRIVDLRMIGSDVRIVARPESR